MYKNTDLSLKHRLMNACETLATSDGPMIARLKSTEPGLLPLLLDNGITHYRAELDGIYEGLSHAESLGAEELRGIAAMIVALAFQVCAET